MVFIHLESELVSSLCFAAGIQSDGPFLLKAFMKLWLWETASSFNSSLYRLDQHPIVLTFVQYNYQDELLILGISYSY